MEYAGWNHLTETLRGKHVLLFGLGLLGGGEHVARVCVRAGAVVRVTDQKTQKELQETVQALKGLDISFTLGEHTEEDISWADIVIKNPSVPTSHPLIQMAIKQGKHVTTEVGLYLKHSIAHVIGITGTRGKTTTTHMVYDILRHHYSSVCIGGNIQGKAALELLSKETKDTWTVLELSSWQLEGCHWENVSPQIGAITNLLEDHLNRYSSLEQYAYDKAAVFLYQKPEDAIVLNKDNAWTTYFSQKVTSRLTYFSSKDLSADIKLTVPGEHNRENAACAYKVALLAGCSPEESVHALERFKGVEFRFQEIRVLNNVRYINDTTSTTPDALSAALHTARSIASSGRVILITGGTSKGLTIDGAVKDMNTYADAVFLLSGSGTDQLKPLLSSERIHGEYSSMKEAVLQAHAFAKPGDIVLLSPGFTSFGMFNNEFDRGKQFTQVVMDL